MIHITPIPPISDQFMFLFHVSTPDGKFVEFSTCVWCGVSVGEVQHATINREQHIRAGCNPNQTTTRLVRAK